MSRKFWIAMVVLAVGSLIGVKLAFARAGDLDRPSISVPEFDGKPDPVVKRMSEVLVSHRKEFIGGHYINAHSILDFAGGTKTINTLLRELSTIEGGVIYVRFSKEGEVSHRLFGKLDGDRPCVCSLNHNGWGDPQTISMTIYTSSPDVDITKLELPAIRGR